MMIKSANTQYSILPAISERWSPRSFSPQEPEKETLMRLFEAARWAPSSMNRQPWFFIVGTWTEAETYEKILSTLNPGNAVWAQDAPVLAITVMNGLRDNGKPNRWAPYDLGQSVANLSIQATADGLYVHQMGGFDREKAANLFHIPEGHEAMTAMAIGYLGRAGALDGDLYERESAPRTRKEIDEFVFNGEWGNPMLYS
jgi:nitroreductase